MKIPTKHLTGSALDWAAAKAGGQDPDLALRHHGSLSASWERAGAILETENISIVQVHDDWLATCDVFGLQRDQDGDACTAIYDHDGKIQLTWYGSTPLIAILRCYVASKLGECVEIPDHLL